MNACCRISYFSQNAFGSTSVFWRCAWVITSCTCADASRTQLRFNRWRRKLVRISLPNRQNGNCDLVCRLVVKDYRSRRLCDWFWCCILWLLLLLQLFYGPLYCILWLGLHNSGSPLRMVKHCWLEGLNWPVKTCIVFWKPDLSWSNSRDEGQLSKNECVCVCVPYGHPME